MENVIEEEPPSVLRIVLRLIGCLFLPFLVLIVFSIIGSGLEELSRNTNVFYMRVEPMLFAIMPLTIALWIALAHKWSNRKATAKKITIISLISVVAFLGLTTALETVNTKPIVAAAASFKVPSGYVPVTIGNADKFTPAPSSIVPCIDFMGEGCPNISKTWDIPTETVPTDKEMQRILDTSGWQTVKKIPDNPFAGKSVYPYEAEGTVNGYKATVTVVELNDTYQLRMYLRPFNSAR